MTILQNLELKLSLLIEQRLSPLFYSSQLTPEWISGFIEAEGGTYGVENGQASFSVSQHISDWYLLEAIALYLGAGSVRPQLRNDGRLCAILEITDKETLEKVIIPLLEGRIRSAKKLAQFNTWRKDYFNLPPITINSTISNEWLLGFVDGDGSFYAIIHKAPDYKCGFQVQAAFDIAQVSTEKALLDQIGKDFFGGTHKWAKSGSTEHLRILKLSAHQQYVETFFNSNTLLSRKYIDFQIWQEMLRMMERQEHLQLSGVETIKLLRERQYLNRKYIHPSIISKILVIRPEWADRLDYLLEKSSDIDN